VAPCLPAVMLAEPAWRPTPERARRCWRGARSREGAWEAGVEAEVRVYGEGEKVKSLLRFKNKKSRLPSSKKSEKNAKNKSGGNVSGRDARSIATFRVRRPN
jgi:hypothetical protein